MEPVVILAGGLGTRLRGVVPDLPKPMAPVAGRPFLEHQLDYWISQGAERFILSVGYRHEAIVGHFGSSYNGASVEYVVEKEPLGTGGGLLLAAASLDDDQSFVAVNGDTYFAVDLPALRTFANAKEADWCLALFSPTEAGRYGGVQTSSGGRVEALTGTAGVSPHANGGVYLVRSRAQLVSLNTGAAKVSLEAELIPSAIALGQRVFGLAFPSLFIDIGLPADFTRAQTVLGRSIQTK